MLVQMSGCEWGLPVESSLKATHTQKKKKLKLSLFWVGIDNAAPPYKFYFTNLQLQSFILQI